MFQTAEIDKIAAIGNELIKGFEKIEESLGQAQLAYMNSEELKTFNEAVSAVQGTIADDEGRGKVHP